MKRILFVLLLSLLLIDANAQQGRISGRIKTSDDQPSEFVKIGLKGTNKACITNGNGEFELKNIDAGTYLLLVSFIGMETRELEVNVKSNETTVIPDVILKESSLQLKEIMVTEYRSANDRSVSIGKMPIRSLDLPQAVAAVDKTVLDNQQSVHLSDAIKNFNGIYIMGTSGGYQEELAGRGFAFNSSNTFKNGVRFNNTAMPEMSSLERIEVMKGSAAILFGNVSAGGVINLVTRKPLFEGGGEVSMRTGSYDFYKPSIDVYGSFNNSKIAAYRINTTYEKSRSFRDGVNSQRSYINPSLLFRLGKKTELLIEGDYLSDNRTADYGVGAINYALIDIPRNRFLGVAWSYYKTEQISSSATITHRLNNNWQIKNVSALQNFKSDLFANQRPNGNSQFIKANGDWIRGLQRTKVNENYYITQLDLSGKFSTGFIKHTLLLGADADKYLTGNTAYNIIARYDTLNVFTPDKYKKRNDIPDLSPRTLSSTPIIRSGIYLQDLLTLTEKIKFLAGIRFSYLETFSKVHTYASGANVETKNVDRAFTPRLGLVFNPIKTMALFVSYSNSFTPNSGIDIDGKALPPSMIDQYEAGIKSDLLKGLLSINLTLYQIKNSNLSQTSLVNGNTSTNIKELSGEVTGRGVEIDVVSKERRGVSIIAGYSYNKTWYSKSNTYIVGSKLLYNPSNTANASIYYNLNELHLSVLSDFNAGVGVVYIGDRLAGRQTRLTILNDSYKPIPLPSYVNIEASLGYSKNNLYVRVKLTNILNKLSYNVHDDNSVNPIAPRQFVSTLGFKF